MTVIQTERGFDVLEHPSHAETPVPLRVAQCSSAIGDYPDSFDRPGSSFLWVGGQHHLNREEVAALVKHLTAWLSTGKLSIPTTTPTE